MYVGEKRELHRDRALNIGHLVCRSVSSDHEGASEIGRQARREADSVARATVRPSNAAWRSRSGH